MSLLVAIICTFSYSCFNFLDINFNAIFCHHFYYYHFYNFFCYNFLSEGRGISANVYYLKFVRSSISVQPQARPESESDSCQSAHCILLRAQISTSSPPPPSPPNWPMSSVSDPHSFFCKSGSVPSLKSHYGSGSRSRPLQNQTMHSIFD
jgi:hypothetical protein